MYYIFSIFIYVILHSFFASGKVKTFFYSNFISYKYYRIVFNLCSTFLLVPIAYLYFQTDKTFFFNSNIYLQIIGILLIIIGLYAWIMAFKSYNISEFLGVDRLKNNQKLHYDFQVTGLNRYIRHPLYTASYPMILGVFLLIPNDYILTTGILIILYFPIGVYFEEKKLIEEFGEQYSDYKKRVPMLIPRIDMVRDLCYIICSRK